MTQDQNRSNQSGKGGTRQATAATRTKNRRSLSLIIYILGMFIIYALDKAYVDTGLVMWFRFLDEDGDSWFNPDMVEAGIQVILVGGFCTFTWMAVKTAKDEEA